MSVLAGKDLQGRPTQISFGAQSRQSLLYVVSPDCSWCKRNEGNMAVLIDRVRTTHRIVLVSTKREGLKEYVVRLRHDWNMSELTCITDFTPETRKAFKLGGTPDLAVLGSDGSVLRSWHGAFVGSTKEEVGAFFGVALPGVSVPQAP